MRMIMELKFPVEPFNTLARAHSAGTKIRQILDEIKPEAVYFSDFDGYRGGILIVDLKDPSEIPALSEPWFLHFHAQVSFRIAMTPEDLGRANIDLLAKKWS